MIEFDKKIREDDILPYGKWGLFRTLIDNFVLILNNHGSPGLSLRLGHARGLTVHRTVIQDPRAASLRRPLPI